MLRRLLGLLLIAALLLAPAARAGGASGTEESSGKERGAPAHARAGADLALVVDYLPPFLYADENSGQVEQLAYSFRVAKREGAEAAPDFVLSWRFRDAAGKELVPGSARGEVKERFALVKGVLEIPRKAQSFEYALESDNRECGAGGALIVREEDGWPAGARASLYGLVGRDGRRLILVLPERTARVDDSWKPIRWIWESSARKSEKVVVIGPRMAAPGNKSYLELLAGSAPKLDVIDLSAPPPADSKEPAPVEAGATRGIFALVEAAENQAAAAARNADLVVLVMPQSDPELATDPRVYRQGLDWVVARLARSGAARVGLVPPMTRRVSEKQLAAYAAVCAETCKVYKARGVKLLDGSRLQAERYWKPPGASGEVTGRFPNESGQEALAGLIKEACQ